MVEEIGAIDAEVLLQARNQRVGLLVSFCSAGTAAANQLTSGGMRLAVSCPSAFPLRAWNRLEQRAERQLEFFHNGQYWVDADRAYRPLLGQPGQCGTAGGLGRRRGRSLTGVADRVPERLQRLVYLDAATPADGQSSADSFPGRRQQLEEQAERSGDGWQIEPGALPPDQPAEITEWATPRRSPMPIKTMTTALKLRRGETTLRGAFVYCTLGKEPGSAQAARAERIRNDPRWRFFELNTGHNLHYSAPAQTVAILLELAKAPVAATRW
jgi:hypothetical protein